LGVRTAVAVLLVVVAALNTLVVAATIADIVTRWSTLKPVELMVLLAILIVFSVLTAAAAGTFKELLNLPDHELQP
jgi:uncharacterized membrane protein YidH (DUF202 family)